MNRGQLLTKILDLPDTTTSALITVCGGNLCIDYDYVVLSGDSKGISNGSKDVPIELGKDEIRKILEGN